jgi:gentisate 1,2-dioxygenase
MSAPVHQARGLREAFYQRISSASLTPLWEVIDQLVPEHPMPRCAPALWRFADVRPFLMEAGQLISAQEATRRVLVLENPGMRGESRITHSLYAGLQLLLPREVAPAHRHTQSALRFVIEGRGAHTTVDGEKAPMSPGDLVLTPSWTWHEHGNESDEPTIWLDGLDVPIVALLDAGFREDAGASAPAPAAVRGSAAGAHRSRPGASLLPVDELPALRAPRSIAYPYARTREALERLRSGTPDACHGYKLRYANPTDGGHVTPTIAAFAQRLPAGFRGAAYRSTDATVFVGVEGRGRSRVASEVFDWERGDVFVVPSWAPCAHETEQSAVLFSVSDRAAQQALGLWREQRSADV